jgi:hypothetical protein
VKEDDMTSFLSLFDKACLFKRSDHIRRS